jgi:hypothetical protein
MSKDELGGLCVTAFDVGLEFGSFDAPLASAANLESADFTGTNQGVDLCRRHVERLGDIGEGKESGRHRFEFRTGHLSVVPFKLTCARRISGC